MSVFFCRVSCDGNCLFHAVSVSLVGNQLLSSTLRELCCIELYQNSDHYANHDFIKNKFNQLQESNIHISENSLFSQCISDEALIVYSENKNKKLAIEKEAAVMSSNLKWSSFIWILVLANILKVSSYYFYMFHYNCL